MVLRRIVWFCCALAVAATVAGAEVIALGGGRLMLAVPAGFQVIARSAHGSTVNLRSESGKVLVALTVQPQRGLLTLPAVRKQVVDDLLEQLRREGKAMGAEVLKPAAIADEPGLYCRVVDTVRTESGTYHRSRAMRLVADQVLSTLTAVNDPDEGRRTKLMKEAEEKLLRGAEVDREGMKRGAGAKAKVESVVAKKAEVKFTVPEGYTAKTEDVAEGVLAVLTDGKNPLRRVTVTVVRIAPPAGGAGGAGAGGGEELESAATEKAVELESTKLALSEPIGEFEAAIDTRFLKRQRRVGGSPESQWASDTRQVQVGERLVSVAMSAPLEDEERTAIDADAVAESVTAVR